MTNDDIHAQLKAIHQELQAVAQAQAVQASSCVGHLARTGNLENTLFGNGRDGIKTQVERLETQGRTRTQLWATIVAAMASLAAVAGVIVMLIQR